MSQEIKVITTCDGCGFDSHRHGFPFVDSLESGDVRLDLCEQCDERGGFICHDCKEIHFAKYSCPKFRKEILSILSTDSVNSLAA